MQKLQLVGRTFGQLTVLRQVETGKPRTWWLCRCTCGTEKVISGNVLSMGKSHSCGCTMYERTGAALATHRRSPANDRTYRSWSMMIQRCTNQNLHAYHDYGGRGIEVCQEWRKSFEAFLRDMGERPPGKTLDRYPDNDGHYEPGNCRWATWHEQASNRRPRGISKRKPK